MPDPIDASIDPAPNGPAWAAILAGATGGFAFAAFTVLSEANATAGKLLQWYRPAGSLSGVAAMAIIIWAIAWAALYSRWHHRELRHQAALSVVTFVLIVIAIVATFPPVYDLL